MVKKASKPKLQSRPPRPKNAEEFISGAERDRLDSPRKSGKKRGIKDRATKSASKRRLPWQAEHVRDDVVKGYALRLPEPYLLKLKFIAANTPLSMNGFIVEVLKPAIDQRVADITNNDMT
ncbi:MAG: hypothetical protein B7733_18700 [Myxococcales bacterium FL481]|nr:MAG: hypothetical protein B7733_18700 [Myxococcales bacterium FL481]